MYDMYCLPLLLLLYPGNESKVYKLCGIITVTEDKSWILLSSCHEAWDLCAGDVLLFVCSFVCCLKHVLVGYWLTGPAVLVAVSGAYHVGHWLDCCCLLAGLDISDLASQLSPAPLDWSALKLLLARPIYELTNISVRRIWRLAHEKKLKKLCRQIWSFL